MAIKDRIKEARLSKKMTQEQLAKAIGVAKTTVTGYEKGTSEPSIDTIIRIMKSLDVDANYLWQDGMKFPLAVSYDEMENTKKFRALDAHGKKLVTLVLDTEYDRVSEKKIVQTIRETPLCQYPYIIGGASAGATSFMTDVEMETIQAPVAEGADFIISVSGDSMEPTFYDGDRVYVKKTPDLDTGDIGIFMVDGSEIYIKELGPDGLISHNPKYRPIQPGSFREIRTIGKVLGKV